MDHEFKPSGKIQSLEKLIGTWKVTGGATGEVTYKWMEGGFFLIQEVNLNQYGQKLTGIEIIGHLRPFGQEPSEDLHSRYYDSMGNTLDYVYELNGNELTIWAGTKGSDAYFKGKFSSDGNTNTGEWVYPDGGGYKSVMTKVS